MDINNFGPFDSDVWGTVSDWFVAIVTAVSIYFLRRTLNSQNETQKLQSSVTNLEFQRYRQSIMPKWGLLINSFQDLKKTMMSISILKLFSNSKQAGRTTLSLFNLAKKYYC